MSKFLLPFLTVSACLFASLSAPALELSDLSLPMSRSEADTALTKDYTYTVLEDMTVRRQWRLSNRVVTVDFSPKSGDKALLIYIDYRSPVSEAACDRDAAMLLHGEPSGWRRLNDKRAEHIGMKRADGLKIEGGRYCFRELDDQGRITRLAYFAGKPDAVRWNLAADANESGHTAMGSRSDGNQNYLWKDEERRRGKAGARSVAATPGKPVAADTQETGSTPAEPHMLARPKDEVDVMDTIRSYTAQLTPTHWAIGGGVILLLLLLRLVKQYREEKRRQAIADYIMTRGQIHVGRPGKVKKVKK